LKLKGFFIVLFFGLWLLSHPLSNTYGAPSDGGYNNFSLSLNGGSFTPFGDIKENKYFPASNEWAFGGGLSFNYHITPVFTLKGQFLMGDLKGSREANDRQFETDLLEGGITARVSFNKLIAPSLSMNKNFNFYGMVGLGAIGFRTKKMTFQTGEIVNTIGYSHDGVDTESREFDMIVPFGLGLDYKLSERVSMGIITAFRYVHSDRLDGRISPTAAKDMYNFTSFGVTYSFGRHASSRDWAPLPRMVYPEEYERLNNLASQAGTLRRQVVSLEEEKRIREALVDEKQRRIEALESQRQQLTNEVNQLQDSLAHVADFGQGRTTAPVDLDEYFAVQVLSTASDLHVDEVRGYFGINQRLDKIHSNGLNKYLMGTFETREEANAQMQTLRSQGIRNATVVKIKDGQVQN